MKVEHSGTAERYRDVMGRVLSACKRVGRERHEVAVVAVSKLQEDACISAAIEVGCRDFGESRVQEWQRKREHFSPSLRWHFIGRIQKNKIRHLVDRVTLIHSIDSESLVHAIERRASSNQEILLQVNIAGEVQKGGVEPEKLVSFALRCAQSPVVVPVGLMCIPPYSNDPENSRSYYREMNELAVETRRALMTVDEGKAGQFKHLSMGMSSDFEVGIEEGATLVRVGSAIFGPRINSQVGKELLKSKDEERAC